MIKNIIPIFVLFSFSIIARTNSVLPQRQIKANKIDQLGIRHIDKEIKIQDIPVYAQIEKTHQKGLIVLSKTSKITNLNISINSKSLSSKQLKNILQKSNPNVTIDDSQKIFWMQENGDLWDKKTYFIKVRKFILTNIEQKIHDYVFVDISSGKVVLRRNYLQHIHGTAKTVFSGWQNINTNFNPVTQQFNLLDDSRGFNVKTLNINGGFNPMVGVTEFTDPDNIWATATPQFDQIAADIHFGLNGAVDYFMNVHNHISHSGEGHDITAYGHVYTEVFPHSMNAFWHPIFGGIFIGDGTVWNTIQTGEPIHMYPLGSVDIVAHEFTHAVTQYTAGLEYSYESGALNESFSDIFGTVIEHWLTPDRADWTLGEDVFNPAGIFAQESPFRSMIDPHSRQHPKCYLGQHWRTGAGDNGGVHYNSSVQNHWFYILVNGVRRISKRQRRCIKGPIKATGIGMEKAAKIAFRTLKYYLDPLSQYHDSAQRSLYAAADLYGLCSHEYKQVRHAWHEVGIPLTTPCPVTHIIESHY